MSQPVVVNVGATGSAGAKFIFFREDGRTFGITDEPTLEDFDHARVGLHVIVRLADQHIFDRRGLWAPLIGGVIAKPEPGTESSPYHVPERFAE